MAVINFLDRLFGGGNEVTLKTCSVDAAKNYKRQYFFVQKCKYFHVQLIIFLADLG
ncbi:hypothetical protein KQH90_02035 [Anaerosalibacter bizertensis]|uniref:hypothetical protein n=1 Tax=Anaerosalibacter bizertensis TaxID=932217 RepID=UPI001C0E9F8F|nr:hypothetical protein [Anaerosalibacter bizertensis]MBU5292817.1 hypothetical protein [Anaerosalibacter bizertensis]